MNRSIVDAIEHIIGRFCIAIGCFGIASIVAIIFLQVCARTLFDYSFSWAEELARYIEVWFICLMAGYAVGTFQHMSVDFLYKKATPPYKKLLSCIYALLYIFFSGILLVEGLIYAIPAFSRPTSSLPFSMGWGYICIPIGSIVIMFYAILILIGRREQR
jgi:TRAP-type C4-dicarboxylate transport system permease small subunit